jgi:hypothetical protein
MAQDDNSRVLLFVVVLIAGLIAGSGPVLAADEQCRWEKCDFPLRPTGASLKTICDCYRTQCGETTPSLECGCEEARNNPGRAIDDKGKDAGTMTITISPDTLPAKGGGTAQINVDVDLTEGRTDVDATFRVAASSGTVSPESFSITRRKGSSPPITYRAPANAEPGDVMIRVFGGWVVILLGQATGTVYEGKACMLLE